MSQAIAQRLRSADYGKAIYLGLATLGWAATNLAWVTASYVGVFALLGGGSVFGAMSHLANLSDRYVAADAARRASFDSILIAVTVVLWVGVSVLRRGSFPKDKGGI